MIHRQLDRRDFCKAAVGSAAGATAWSMAAAASQAATFEADELSYTSASELLPLFRSRKLSPVEVLKAQIAR